MRNKSVKSADLSDIAFCVWYHLAETRNHRHKCWNTLLKVECTIVHCIEGKKGEKIGNILEKKAQHLVMMSYDEVPCILPPSCDHPGSNDVAKQTVCYNNMYLSKYSFLCFNFRCKCCTADGSTVNWLDAALILPMFCRQYLLASPTISLVFSGRISSIE